MIDKLNELLQGEDIYGLNVNGFVATHVKDNNQTAYLHLQTIILLKILEKLEEKDKVVEAVKEDKKVVKPTKAKEGTEEKAK